MRRAGGARGIARKKECLDEATEKRAGGVPGGRSAAAHRRAAGGLARPVGERAGGHAGRGAPRHGAGQPVRPDDGEPGDDLGAAGDGLPAAGRRPDPGFRHPPVPVPAGEAAAGAGGAGGFVRRHGQGKQPPPQPLFGGLPLCRRSVHFCGHPVRAAGAPGGHRPRPSHHPARPAVRCERRHRHGHPVLSGDPVRRRGRQRPGRRGKDPEGVLPAHIHELPSLRRAAQRPFGDGAGILLRGAQLCAPRGGGGAVHPAPRPDPDLRAHHAHRAVLRRGVRALSQEGEKEKAPSGKRLSA